MNDNYQNAIIRGRQFRGADLTHASFAGADVRGADFTGAHLVGADFSNCRCGLRRWWSAGLYTGILIAAIISGAVTGFASAVPASSLFIFSDKLPDTVRPLVVVGTLLLTLVPLAILLRNGIFAAYGLTGVLAALAAVSAILSPTEYSALVFITLVLINAAIAAVITLACAATTASRLGARWIVIVLFACAVLAAVPAMVEGIDAIFTSPDPNQSATSPINFVIGASFLVAYLGCSYYVFKRAPAGNTRFGFVTRVATGALTRGGTKFRGADLSDCNFTAANLDHADLSNTILTRSNWYGATHLERARLHHTVLQNPAILQLAVTHQGKDQSYAGLNLQDFYLSKADLSGASLIGTNLIGAILYEADLTGAKLVQALLYDADLSGAVLTGAYIQEWGISGGTRFDGVQCTYIYMRLPTVADPDPQRKPDNRGETFQPGDFADFIKPISKTHDLYYREDLDVRTIVTAFKSLDLFQTENIDPLASAVALTQLAERHPDADLQLVAVEAHGAEKLRLQTAVAAGADRSALSEDFDALYRTASALPQAELAATIAHKDEQIRHLESLVRAATEGKRFYMETTIVFGASVKCVLFAANPIDTERLRLDMEIRQITTKVQESKYRDVLEIIPVMAARPDDLLLALNRYHPQIIHFSGHATSAGAIVLEDEEGAAKPVSTDALVALFTTLKAHIRLVILNACFATHQAEAIISVIDTAIGMNQMITDRAAIKFIAAFYRALGFGCSIQAAFDQGVTALLLEGITEANTPQLLVRPGVDAASIVLVAPETT